MMIRVVFVFITVFTSLNSLAQPLLIGVPQENANILEYKQDQFTGAMSESVACVLNQLPNTYLVITAPHIRILKMLENGQLDLAVPFVQMKERDVYADFAGPLWTAHFKFITHSAQKNDDKQALQLALKQKGYSSKRGTYIHQLIPSLLGMPFEDAEFMHQEVLTWEDAIVLVKLNRSAITMAPRDIVAGLDEDIVSELFISDSIALDGSFYVSKTSNHDELFKNMVTLVKACRANN